MVSTKGKKKNLMTRERAWLTLINAQNITANSDVEKASNVVYVDFGRKAAAPKALAA